MKLFAGLSRTDYQDILRAVGAMIDARGWRDVRIWEHADGLLVQGRRTGVGEFEQMALTDAELDKVLQEAYARRSRR